MKTHLEIIDRLIDDTISSRLLWYDDGDYFRSTIRTEKHGLKLDTIFKLSDCMYSDPANIYTTYEDDDIITVDIYIKKNAGGKEIFCIRIKDHQLKLLELLNVVMHFRKKVSGNKEFEIGDKVRIKRVNDVYHNKFGQIRNIIGDDCSVKIGFNTFYYGKHELEKIFDEK